MLASKYTRMIVVGITLSCIIAGVFVFTDHDDIRYHIEHTNNILRGWKCPAGGYPAGPGASVLCLECPVGHKCAGGNSPRRLCSRGTYQSRKGQNSCIPSPPGHYVSTRGAIKPTPCPYGHYTAKRGQHKCTPASLGHKVSSRRAKHQSKCTQGRYQNHRGQRRCKPAPKGSYVNTYGASKPTPCNYGMYNPNVGRSRCQRAMPGYYVPSRGSAVQIPCKKNHFQRCAGQPMCIPCQVGFRTAGTGAIRCQRAPRRQNHVLLATPKNLATIGGLKCKSYKYLYVDANKSYLSPPTKKLWKWNGGGVQVTGVYKYSKDGGKTWKEWTCKGSSERPSYGIGCSNGPGKKWKTIPWGIQKNPMSGRAIVCQDYPGIFPNVCQWVQIRVVGLSCL